MKLIGYFVAIFIAVLMLVPQYLVASDKLNFSGKYVVERKNASQEVLTLEVIQNDDGIEITREKLGKKTVSHCPLNGSYGNYSGLEGDGRCTAQLSPKYLIIESDVLTPIALTHSQHDSSQLRMHVKAKWQLSEDAKTLTIKSDRNLPKGSASIFVVGSMSDTVKYTRVSPNH